jgi:hypothetical protein
MARPTPVTDGPFAALLAEVDHLLGVDRPASQLLGARDNGGLLAQRGFAYLVGQAHRRGLSGSLLLEADAGDRTTLWFDAGHPIDVVPATASAAERVAATSTQIERWFFAAAAIGPGRFTWSPPTATGSHHRTHHLRHPAALVHETLLRHGTDVARAWLGPDTACLQLRREPTATAIVEAAFDDPELRAAVRLFDGQRSFRDVVRGTRLDDEVLLRAAFVGFCFGAIEFARAPIDSLGPASPLQEAPPDRARVAALARLADQSDYFTFLGVDRAASRREIQTSVERLSYEISDPALHPDVALATGAERAAITEVLIEASRILGDDGLRAQYRAALGREPTATPESMSSTQGA